MNRPGVARVVNTIGSIRWLAVTGACGYVRSLSSEVIHGHTENRRSTSHRWQEGKTTGESVGIGVLRHRANKGGRNGEDGSDNTSELHGNRLRKERRGVEDKRKSDGEGERPEKALEHDCADFIGRQGHLLSRTLCR